MKLKKVKHDFEHMETMEVLPDECKEQLRVLKKSVYDILGGLMGTSCFESLLQEHSADNGTETD